MQDLIQVLRRVSKMDCELPEIKALDIKPLSADDSGVMVLAARVEIEQSFLRSLSSESRHFRFMHGLNELTQPMPVRFTQLDYDRELRLCIGRRR